MSDGQAPQLTDAELTFLEGVLDLAREGRTTELLEMVRAGVPVNLTNARGDTLLILAAYHQRAETVVGLLEAGADTDRVNGMGQTALASAIFRNSEPIVRSLLEAGADPMIGSHSGLAIARQFGLTGMESVLLEYGSPA